MLNEPTSTIIIRKKYPRGGKGHTHRDYEYSFFSSAFRLARMASPAPQYPLHPRGVNVPIP